MSDNPRLEDLIKKENRKEIERQLERLGFYTFNNFQLFSDKINELNVKVSALINYLNIQGIGRSEMIDELQNILLEKYKSEDLLLSNEVYLRKDNPEFKNFTPLPVNCDERIHLCKAVCCRMKFKLSAEEVEKGEIKWDLGIPYQIRQRKSGYCFHINDKKTCSKYEDRPQVCKNYSCVEDKRIWIDFEKMILNEKWIKENLKEKVVRFHSTDLDNHNAQIHKESKEEVNKD